MAAGGARRQNVVLVACGSFNPVTNLHLRMFEAARDALRKTGRYRVLAGILSPVSDGYRKDGLASAGHRLAMARLALQRPAAWIRLGSWEAGLADWTPTRQVLQHYQSVIDACARAEQEEEEEEEAAERRQKRRRIGDDPEDYSWLSSLLLRAASSDPSAAVARPMLLCGADVLRTFATPGVWEEKDMLAIVRDFGMAVVTRPGSDPQKFVYEFDLINPYERNIEIVTEWCNSDLSSTLVRRAIRRGESVRYLLPDPVIDYIHAHSLYGYSAKRMHDEAPDN